LSTSPVATKFQTGHVGLNVSNLDRSVDFYTRVFGFEVKMKVDGEKAFAFLGDESRDVLTLWQQAGGAFATDKPGLHHLSFQVDSIEDVKAAQERVEEVGARLYHDGIVPHAEGFVSGGIYFEDPDGLRLEIYASSGADDHLAAPSGQMPTCGFF
jgi:lactoylglutathione lyase